MKRTIAIKRIKYMCQSMNVTPEAKLTPVVPQAKILRIPHAMLKNYHLFGESQDLIGKYKKVMMSHREKRKGDHEGHSAEAGANDPQYGKL